MECSGTRSERLSAPDIVAAVIAVRGFDAGDRTLQTAVGELVKAMLAPMRRRGVVEKIGQGRCAMEACGKRTEAQGLSVRSTLA
jgi:hypothetical protein